MSIKAIPWEIRLWRNINIGADNECWNWKTGIRGRIYKDGATLPTTAARLVYELVYGQIPDGMCICHHCDNGACHNPKHLFAGTHKDNIQDMLKKGRQSKGPGYGGWTPSGKDHYRWSISDDAVTHIKNTYVRGSKIAGISALAKYHNISISSVSRIINNKRQFHRRRNRPDV